ncbi:nickel ABC transporter permease subunit NikC [Helicobacter equorum]|uniref:nickel ABC transporter permease subunit NikC n=1 Tax=Helicobacter equorum TaxID=361872 RepID=UPI001F3CD7E2|nr:nickel ABC transporter permease subunit NikC [Helicobacter equorum]
MKYDTYTPYRHTSFFAHTHNIITTMLFVVFVLFAIFAPYITPYDPNAIDITQKFAPISFDHIFGCDHLGRDIFSRILHGMRISLGSSTIILTCIVILGISIGGLCGFVGGKIDSVIMRVCDVLLSMPTLVLALFFVGVLGVGLVNVILAIILTHWAWYARIVRSIVLSLKNKEYIVLSSCYGCNQFQSFRRHILRPVLSQCMILASMDLGHMMLHIAALSFIGLGVQAPMAEWGIMLSESKDYLWSYPQLMLYPGGALFISVALCNIIGEKLRAYYDMPISHT